MSQNETLPVIQASGSPVSRRQTSESRSSTSPAAHTRSSSASSSAATNPEPESSAASASRSFGIGTSAIGARSSRAVHNRRRRRHPAPARPRAHGLGAGVHRRLRPPGPTPGSGHPSGRPATKERRRAGIPPLCTHTLRWHCAENPARPGSGDHDRPARTRCPEGSAPTPRQGKCGFPPFGHSPTFRLSLLRMPGGTSGNRDSRHRLKGSNRAKKALPALGVPQAPHKGEQIGCDWRAPWIRTSCS